MLQTNTKARSVPLQRLVAVNRSHVVLLCHVTAYSLEDLDKNTFFLLCPPLQNQPSTLFNLAGSFFQNLIIQKLNTALFHITVWWTPCVLACVFPLPCLFLPQLCLSFIFMNLHKTQLSQCSVSNISYSCIWWLTFGANCHMWLSSIFWSSVAL